MDSHGILCAFNEDIEEIRCKLKSKRTWLLRDNLSKFLKIKMRALLMIKRRKLSGEFTLESQFMCDKNLRAHDARRKKVVQYRKLETRTLQVEE